MNESQITLLDAQEQISFEYPEGFEQAVASLEALGVENARAYVKSILFSIGLM